MKKLLKGIVDFRRDSLEAYREKFSSLALDHNPDALFVACCDSRVVPNVFASSDPGDLFVLRNIGNLIPSYHHTTECNCPVDTSVAAAIEFSLLSLNVQTIVICGHSECGAMNTLIENGEAPCQLPTLKLWLECAAPSYKRFKNSSIKDHGLSPCNFLSRINVLQQIDHLKTYPLVMERLQSNKLKLYGWWFDLTTANVYHYDKKIKEFVLIDEEEANILLQGDLNDSP